MSSFQTTIAPSRRAAARFIVNVRMALRKALLEENADTGLVQSDVARSIGVHRSVISRELGGYKDVTLGRIAELAWAMDREPHFELVKIKADRGANVRPVEDMFKVSQTGTQTEVRISQKESGLTATAD